MDWSSDVCSSDLPRLLVVLALVAVAVVAGVTALAVLDVAAARPDTNIARRDHGRDRVLVDHLADGIAQQPHELVERLDRRSAERRVGKECVRKCRIRGSAYHLKKKQEKNI